MAARYGPALPPDILAPSQEEPDDREESKTSNTSLKTNTYGPALPPDLLVGNAQEEAQATEVKSSSKSQSRPVIGPALPPGFADEKEEEYTSTGTDKSSTDTDALESERFTGPFVPGSSEITETNALSRDTGAYEDEYDVIGPVLPVQGLQEGTAFDLVKESIESRAKKMQNKLTATEEDVMASREEWMIELPPEFTVAAVGARKFRSANPEMGDQSVWTDTPAERERKRQEAALNMGKTKPPQPVVPVQLSERDIQMEKMTSEYNDNYRKQSLMDIHKRKRKVEGTEQERRPFDRDRDLEITRVLPSGKRREMTQQSSRELSSKFAPSSQQKFL